MIDIIIPTYNAHETLKNALASIALQTVKNIINVYVVDDCSNEGYEDVISDFSNIINVKILKTKYNSGPGVARQLGLDCSSGKYIMFLDADDLLYDCFSVENLYRNIDGKNLDSVIGKMYEEKEDGSFEIHQNHTGCLHAKMYRRSFIDKFDFKFNNTYSSEDKAFNNLFFLAEPKFELISDDIYVYNYNVKSLTRKDLKKQVLDYINGIGYNMHWVYQEAMKRKFNINKIAELMFNSLYGIYEYYNGHYNMKDADKILECGLNLYDDVMYLKDYCDMEKYYKDIKAIAYISFDEFKSKIIELKNNCS